MFVLLFGSPAVSWLCTHLLRSTESQPFADCCRFLCFLWVRSNHPTTTPSVCVFVCLCVLTGYVLDGQDGAFLQHPVIRTPLTATGTGREGVPQNSKWSGVKRSGNVYVGGRGAGGGASPLVLRASGRLPNAACGRASAQWFSPARALLSG